MTITVDLLLKSRLDELIDGLPID